MNNEIKFLPPFKRMCMSIGTLPSSFYASMSYYESMVWLYEYLKNEVIPVVNNNSEVAKELQDAFIALENYIENYFDNLDIQEEINVKLDEMAEDGTLADIVAEYIRMQGQLVYDTVADMKLAENIQNGSFLKTYGYHNVNDDGGAYYKARTITNEDVIDESTIIALNDVTLVAELIADEINIQQFGCYGDGTHDDSTKFKLAITKAKEKNKKLVAPSGKTYLISEKLDVSNLYVDLNESTLITSEDIDMLEINSQTYYGECRNINIDCNNAANSAIKITEGRKHNLTNINILNVKTYGFYYVTGYEILINNMHITGSSASNSTGMYVTGGDSTFNNIIIIDCKTAIHNINGFNIYNNIHAWLLSATLIPASTFIKVNGGKCILQNCYSDTYQYSLYQDQQIPILIATNFTTIYNHGIYTDTIAAENIPVFYYCGNADGMSLSRITGALVDGYSATYKTKLTNQTNFTGCLANSFLKNCDKNLPTVSLITSTTTANVTVDSSYFQKDSKTVFGNVVAHYDFTSNKSINLGTIPYYFRNSEIIVGTASYGTGTYNIEGVCYMYIGTNGLISITLPDTVTGVKYVKVDLTFITGIEQ